MKIAVTYENGQIFQHFGHTKQFKIYTAEDRKIINSEVIDTSGSGQHLQDFFPHSAWMHLFAVESAAVHRWR